MSFNNKELLKDCIMHLIDKEPFYADLIMGMVVHINTNILTVGVNVTENVNLYINPYFWKSLDLEGQVNVIKHEALHVLNNHFARRNDLDPIFDEVKDKKELKNDEIINVQQKASKFNKSADYAINQFLSLPKKFKMYDKNGKPLTEPEFILKEDGNIEKNPNYKKEFEAKPLLIEDLIKENPKLKIQKEQTTEYYYDVLTLLEKEQKQNKGNKSDKGNNGSTIDDHSLWEVTKNIDPNYVKEKVKAFVKKAVEKTRERNCGNIPSELQSIIDALNYEPKDWRSDLRKFIANSYLTLIKRTRKRRNRRYGILLPGVKRYPKLSIAVLFDASGSVGDEEAGQFFAEINEIYKKDIHITIIEFDSDVNAVYEYSDRKENKLHGRGGTCFAPAFKKAEELNPDGIIILTDGCNFDVEQVKKPKQRVLWALLEGCKCNYDWGFKTELVVKKKLN